MDDMDFMDRVDAVADPSMPSTLSTKSIRGDRHVAIRKKTVEAARPDRLSSWCVWIDSTEQVMVR